MKSYRALFSIGPFRRFWLGLLGVMVADELVRTTLVWHVYDSTRSSAAVGTLLLFLTGPIVVSGLVAGWLLDRLPRARVLLLDSGVRVLVLLAAITLIGFGDAGPDLYFTVAAMQGTLLMVVLAGAPAAIADLVPDGLRPAANAMEMLAFSSSAAAGPFFAGELLARFPVWAPLLAAAACYAAFATVVAPMRLGGGVGAGTRPSAGGMGGSGMLDPTVLTITLMFLAYNIGYGIFAAGLPEAVGSRFGGSSSTYGLLLAAAGIGSGVGAALAGTASPALNLKVAILFAQVAAGLALVAFAIASNVATALAAVATFGLCSGPLTVWAQTIRMRIVPPEWRGRAFATLRMIMQAGRPMGGAAGGHLFPLLPMGLYFAVSGGVIAMAACLGATRPNMRASGNQRPTSQ